MILHSIDSVISECNWTTREDLIHRNSFVTKSSQCCPTWKYPLLYCTVFILNLTDGNVPSFQSVFVCANVCEIGQLPRLSREDPERIRVDSVFETFICVFSACKQIFSFSLFQPSLFIQYSTEECSTVQLFIYKIIAVMIDIDTSWDWIAIYGPVQYSTV